MMARCAHVDFIDKVGRAQQVRARRAAGGDMGEIWGRYGGDMGEMLPPIRYGEMWVRLARAVLAAVWGAARGRGGQCWRQHGGKCWQRGWLSPCVVLA